MRVCARVPIATISCEVHTARMTKPGTEIDQQAALLRMAERTASAAESIRLILSLWSIFAVLGLFVWLILATAT